MSRRARHELTIGRAILRTAQERLKKRGIITQLRNERGVNLLRFQGFVCGGQFEVDTTGSTTLHFQTNATNNRRSYFTKIFPDAANPDFDPEDVINLIVNVGLHLQRIREFFSLEDAVISLQERCRRL